MNKKQSLFHIAKRDTLPWYKSFAIRGCAILLALVVCAVVTMLLTGENPVNIFATIFKGAFGSARKSWVTFQNLAVLLGISLAVTPAFKMRFWNIGAEGQVLIGCLATAACMICLASCAASASFPASFFNCSSESPSPKMLISTPAFASSAFILSVSVTIVGISTSVRQ